MGSIKDIIQFSIIRVRTEQFALIADAFSEVEETNLNTNIRFTVDDDEQGVSVFSRFRFEQKETPFLIVEVSCQFVIAPASWAEFTKNETAITIPKEFMIHLSMITVGTARGVLHSKTEGTKFNDFVLPTINVKEMVKNDVTFSKNSDTIFGQRKRP